MSIIVIPKNLDAESDYAKLHLNVSDGLEYIGLGTDNLVKATRNFAPNKPDGIVVGEPKMVGNVIELNSLTDYIDTGVAETSEMTFFIVGRAVNPGAVTLEHSTPVGNFSNIDGLKTGVFFRVAVTRIYFEASRGSVSANDPNDALVSISRDATEGNTLYIGRVTNSETSIRRGANGEASKLSSTTPRLTSERTLRIGSAVTHFTGKSAMPFVAIYSRALSENEIQEVCSSIKKLMAKKGISV